MAGRVDCEHMRALIVTLCAVRVLGHGRMTLPAARNSVASLIDRHICNTGQFSSITKAFDGRNGLAMGGPNAAGTMLTCKTSDGSVRNGC